MTSIAEQRRKRKAAFNISQRQAAGRPRLDGERYPSGDLKRSETEAQVKSVAIEAANRVHGIVTDGKDGLHGYTLGRMRLDGKITEDELKAGNWYGEQVARYHALTGVPFPSARAQDLFAVRGESGEVSQTRAEAATKAKEMNSALAVALIRCEDGARVRTTVFNVCVMDVEGLRMMPATQLAMLKRGLQKIMFMKG